MSGFNGAGLYTISGSGLPFVPGTTISSTVVNQLDSDLATGLSTCLLKDGTQTLTANIPFAGFKATGLGVGTVLGDALSYGNAATVAALIASGTVTPQGLVDISGAGAGQIKFPATQNASANVNTLDDYEEGTFTPLLDTNATGFSSVTYPLGTPRFGAYTKTGNRVDFNLRMQTDVVVIGSASGSVIITGLPFAANSAGAMAVSVGFSLNFAGNYPSSAAVLAGTSTIAMYYRATSAGASVALAPADIGTSTGANDITIGGTYYI